MLYLLRRAWVVQEVTLAKYATIICGGPYTAWAAFVSAAVFLQKCGCYPRISGRARAVISGYTLRTALERFLGPDGVPDYIGGISDPNPDDRSLTPLTTISAITDVRSGLSIGDRFLRVAPDAKPYGLLDHLRTFRECKCSDLRDKVYTLLGLVPDQSVSKSARKLVSIDYTASVGTVCLEAAWAVLQQLNNLLLLPPTSS